MKIRKRAALLAGLVLSDAGCGSDGGSSSLSVSNSPSPASSFQFQMLAGVRAYYSKAITVRASGIASDKTALLFAATHPASEPVSFKGVTRDSVA